MDAAGGLPRFGPGELAVINEAVAVAEEMTSDIYKMSFAEWRRRRYDIKTAADLEPGEIVQGAFAQIIRYVGRKRAASLGSLTFDFYKICLQDHNILAALGASRQLRLFPFALYIVTHELIHVIRFTNFSQAFEATSEEKLAEEARVHERTRETLGGASRRFSGMDAVFEFYGAWEGTLDRVQDGPEGSFDP